MRLVPARQVGGPLVSAMIEQWEWYRDGGSYAKHRDFLTVHWEAQESSADVVRLHVDAPRYADDPRLNGLKSDLVERLLAAELAAQIEARGFAHQHGKLVSDKSVAGNKSTEAFRVVLTPAQRRSTIEANLALVHEALGPLVQSRIDPLVPAINDAFGSAAWAPGRVEPATPPDGRTGHAIYRRVLLMVSELHVRGYQRLRIAPGMAPSGLYWRCSVTPVTNISDSNGALMVSWDHLAAHYSSADVQRYFGWDDASGLSPSPLAARFIERCPEISDTGRGSDWTYAGWYQEMLGTTYPDALPIAYADWPVPPGFLSTVGGRGGVRVPMPPPGECACDRR